MISVSVKTEGSGFTVVVENNTSGYKRAFESYEPKQGVWGMSVDSINDARELALVDAQDWVAKFQQAGIAATLVSA